MKDDDVAHMRAALALARRGLGNTWPNPAVGCVIVQGGRVVGRGWTAPGGRPHAETQALAEAGEAARGATAYVTLEPCSHHGKTPPCADALVAAGVARGAWSRCGDPDPRVNGRGLACLRAAGIEVEEDVLAGEAEEAQAGFLTRVRAGPAARHAEARHHARRAHRDALRARASGSPGPEARRMRRTRCAAGTTR